MARKVSTAERRDIAADTMAEAWLRLAEANGIAPVKRVHSARTLTLWDAPETADGSIRSARPGMWTRAGRQPSVDRLQDAIGAAWTRVQADGGIRQTEERASRATVTLERLISLTDRPLAYYTAETFSGWTHDSWRGFRGGAPAPSDCLVSANAHIGAPMLRPDIAYGYNLSANVRARASRKRDARRLVACMTPEQAEAQRARKRADAARRRERAAGASQSREDAAREYVREHGTFAGTD